MKKKITLAIILCIMMINSAIIASLLSWSNVPDPAKTNLGWMDLLGVILYFPILFLIASDELH